MSEVVGDNGVRINSRRDRERWSSYASVHLYVRMTNTKLQSCCDEDKAKRIEGEIFSRVFSWIYNVTKICFKATMLFSFIPSDCPSDANEGILDRCHSEGLLLRGWNALNLREVGSFEITFISWWGLWLSCCKKSGSICRNDSGCDGLTSWNVVIFSYLNANPSWVNRECLIDEWYWFCVWFFLTFLKIK